MPKHSAPNQKADTQNSSKVNLSPNNNSYKAAQDNHSQQLNPDSSKSQGKKP